jgi:pimeloyl-ACP methyl ester carboxylesterase
LKILAILAGGLLATLIVAGVWAFAPDRSRTDLLARYLRPADSFLEVAGTPVRVRDSGPRDAPVLLLLHGFGSSLETWEPWALALSDEYRVVRFDMPGSGLSEPDRSGDYSDSRGIALVRALMERMGIARVALIGNSMGGRVAWKFAAAYPDLVSKLVLISPDGFAVPGFEYGRPPKVPAFLQLMRYFAPKSLFRANLRVAYAHPARLTPAVVDRYYDLLLAPGNRRAILSRMEQMLPLDPEPVLRHLAAPTLLMWGEADHMIPFANAGDYLRVMPHARLVSFSDLGHVPQEEAPDESLPALRQFLAE